MQWTPVHRCCGVAFGLPVLPILSRCNWDALRAPESQRVQRTPATRACHAGQHSSGEGLGDSIFQVSPYVTRRIQRARSLGKQPSVGNAASRLGDESVRVDSMSFDATTQGVEQDSENSPSDAGESHAGASPPEYASHEMFVESVLAMTDDPLEQFGGRVVTYRGSPAANVMIIGEAPGKDEDLQGKPFVGKAGMLLNDIFTYAGFDMDKHVYLTNVAKRRPPDNRNPSDSEIEFYMPLLLEEIRLVDPSLIVLAGAIPLRAVLNLTGITKVRGQIFSVHRAGRVREVMPVFHPAYLLRNVSKKAEMKVDIDTIRAKYMKMFPGDTLAPLRTTKPRRLSSAR